MTVVDVGSRSYAALAVGEIGAAIHVTLNRPAARNAIDNTLGIELLDVLREIAADDAVRAVLITGAGSSFCAGADLGAERELTPRGHQDLGGRLRRRTNPMICAIRQMPKPVVAAVNGPAVGIGCSLALACDLILAAESAQFVLGFARVGLAMDGGSSAFLPARVGIARAAELAMLGRRLAAAEALAWGLVNDVHPDDELPRRAASLVADLAAGPTLSYVNIKRALNQAVYPDLDAQLDIEAEYQQLQAESNDFAEALAAFKEKRDPVFTGS